MKKMYDDIKMRMKQNWSNFMHSAHKKLSIGSENILKLITTAHKDQWRRSEHHKKSKRD